MTANGWIQIFIFFGAVLAIAKPLGTYMAKVFSREKTFADFLFRPMERLVYRVTGIDETREMRWTEYATSMLWFSLISLVVTYALQRLQQYLPLNPQHLPGVAPDLALNTSISFTANTNWQSYVPETTVSYLTQMAGLAYHNFVSAAVGIAVAVAFVRGISRKESKSLGNFWVDTTRALFWVLLPTAFICALLLVSQGVVQNFRPYDQAKLLQPQTVTTVGADDRLHTAP
jgi:K+-transporting ATPase ATPase A chain